MRYFQPLGRKAYAQVQIAAAFADMHDFKDAFAELAQADLLDPLTKPLQLFLHARQALDENRSVDAIHYLTSLKAGFDPNSYGSLGFDPDIDCLLAYAHGIAGHRRQSSSLFVKIRHETVACLVLHADVLLFQNRRKDAKQKWHDGEKLAADLPYVYIHRGIAETHRKDFADAEKDLTLAVQKAPYFADSIKALGDLYVLEGRMEDARNEYKKALSRAPSWIDLQTAFNRLKQ